MRNLAINPDLPASPEPPAQPAAQQVPADAGQRLHQLIGLAADLAFETDAEGRFIFVLPDDALGWPRGALLGQPAATLLGRADQTEAMPDPFCPAEPVSRRRVWLRRFDGTPALMAISATPCVDDQGRPCGARGIAVGLHDMDLREPHLARRLRRMEVLDLLLERIGRESSIETMMDAALWALLHALGAEGAAIVGPRAPGHEAEILHSCGPGAQAIGDTALLMLGQRGGPRLDRTPDGRLLMLLTCPTRFGARDGIVFWRTANGLAWAEEDAQLASAAAGVIRIILDYEAVQHEMAHQARTDPLTELMNRRAFLEELTRHMARLDREQAPGTLIFLDLDGFKLVNDQFGHAAGDRILVHVADRLRKLVRPNDLVARLGGDEFAVWLSGVDHMTAAERADVLCKTLPDEFQALLPDPGIRVGASIGIATRQRGSREVVAEVLRRADSAMYQVKRGGRGHWRVWLGDQL